jgi:cytosine/adenosine deaminase-related metal-dependent hydrolase
MCLRLDVVPVFAPPQKVGARFHHDSLDAVQERSRCYIRILKKHRVKVAYCPASNMFCGLGTAPVVDYHQCRNHGWHWGG